MNNNQKKKTRHWTLNAASNCSHGTVSHLGYAFRAAASLYAPGRPQQSDVTADKNSEIRTFWEKEEQLISIPDMQPALQKHYPGNKQAPLQIKALHISEHTQNINLDKKNEKNVHNMEQNRNEQDQKSE